MSQNPNIILAYTHPLIVVAAPDPLILKCSADLVSDPEHASVMCTSSRDLEGLNFECSFNDQPVIAGCTYVKIL